MKAKWFVTLGLFLLLAALFGSGVSAAEPAGQIEAVKLIGAWVDAGAPETGTFKFTGKDGKTYEATFADDVLPLFTTKDAWFKGSDACSTCHYAVSKDSAHEMDLGTYKGILTGAD
ncbi:MAG: hypothetical protein HY741_30045, partial [Chloroflexi bacterium]|nr:hypothetical protein [Chloroflexota bacterium]